MAAISSRGRRVNTWLGWGFTILPLWRPGATYLTVKSMTADVLATQGVKTSAVVVLTYFSWDIQILAGTKRVNQGICPKPGGGVFYLRLNIHAEYQGVHTCLYFVNICQSWPGLFAAACKIRNWLAWYTVTVPIQGKFFMNCWLHVSGNWIITGIYKDWPPVQHKVTI